MTTETKKSYTQRERVLALLSDEETATVSNAESGARLLEGEEYLDLEQLSKGVMTAGGAAVALGRALPKKAVKPATWATILTSLAGEN